MRDSKGRFIKGHTKPTEMIEKISKSLLGRKNPEHSKRMTGRKLTDEHKRKIGMKSKKHGMWKSGVYSSWQAMKRRCDDKNWEHAYLYFDRGIKYCEEWVKFENFYRDMGDRPKGKTLDRINNDGDYEIGNCRWATPRDQQMNRRNNK
jgi:hypothetical protein